MLKYPVAIGGVGGSGTRLIAGILQDLGYYMGSDLNDALDNLWFTLLFKRLNLFDCQVGFSELHEMAHFFVQGMTRSRPFDGDVIQKIQDLAAHDRLQHPAAWLAIRAKTLLAAPHSHENYSHAWGWKEPNTHIFMDRLPTLIPNLRYIHVMRNGLDMAFSQNQNQQRLWGPSILGIVPGDTVFPSYSLRYWCVVHRRIIDIGRSMGPGRFLLINYDRFCTEPSFEMESLLRFLKSTHVSILHKTRLISMVQPSATMGRYKAKGLGFFEPEDVEYVKSLGFDTDDSMVHYSS